MSFLDTLKNLGLWQGGQPQAEQPNPYGLDPAIMQQARMSALGNVGGQLLAMSQQMTPDQRARLMANADWSGGYQGNLMNAAQMQLMGDSRRRKTEEDDRGRAAREWLTQKIAGLPDGKQKQNAMIYLQMGDLQNAAAQLTAEPRAMEAPTTRTVRVGDQDITYQWLDGQWQKMGEGPAFKPETAQAPSSVREYEYAVSQGYEGTYEDFLKMATAAKAGVALPAEMGARIGLGDEFLTEDLPGIKKDVAEGVATGPLDYLTGWAGRGRQGEIRRRLLTGVDALRRNLTGAGMSATETEEYVGRYLPSMTDDAKTLASKIDGLERDLRAVKGGAVAGKTGSMVRDQGAPQPKTRLKYNPETGELE
jgi:hypothetical protein